MIESSSTLSYNICNVGTAPRRSGNLVFGRLGTSGSELGAPLGIFRGSEVGDRRSEIGDSDITCQLRSTLRRKTHYGSR